MQRIAMATTLALAVAGCAFSSETDPTVTSPPATSSTTSIATTAPSTTTGTSAPTPTTTVITTLSDLEVGRQALLTLAASSGGEVDLSGLGFAEEVSLGVHNVLSVNRSKTQLTTAEGWTIGVREYAGFSGPFSPLEALRSARALVIDEGSHPHCAGPPLGPPSGFEEASRVHAQPKDIDSCIAWFSVDFWIVDGTIQAVTLALFGP